FAGAPAVLAFSAALAFSASVILAQASAVTSAGFCGPASALLAGAASFGGSAASAVAPDRANAEATSNVSNLFMVELLKSRFGGGDDAPAHCEGRLCRAFASNRTLGPRDRGNFRHLFALPQTTGGVDPLQKPGAVAAEAPSPTRDITRVVERRHPLRPV